MFSYLQKFDCFVSQIHKEKEQKEMLEHEKNHKEKMLKDLIHEKEDLVQMVSKLEKEMDWCEKSKGIINAQGMKNKV